MAEKSIVNPCWTRAATGLLDKGGREGEWWGEGGRSVREGGKEGEKNRESVSSTN